MGVFASHYDEARITRRLASDRDWSRLAQASMERYAEIFIRMYQDKLSQLKKQLSMLKDGSLPEYQKKLKKIDLHFQERQRLSEIWYSYEVKTQCNTKNNLGIGN